MSKRNKSRQEEDNERRLSIKNKPVSDDIEVFLGMGHDIPLGVIKRKGVK